VQRLQRFQSAAFPTSWWFGGFDDPSREIAQIGLRPFGCACWWGDVIGGLGVWAVRSETRSLSFVEIILARGPQVIAHYQQPHRENFQSHTQTKYLHHSFVTWVF